ncbi:hypothetical protein, partial [Avibacterium paragallinarum]|uniref:hypothetical protein n=1 Tax=Avibacterium paragallinarum TaxID=728 RepID=UPI000D4DDC03
THPSYTTNAHARGIGFSYGSYNGNQAWDIFTTAFDANGTYLGQKQIMTELGGIFRGDINLNNNMLGFSADTNNILSIARILMVFGTMTTATPFIFSLTALTKKQATQVTQVYRLLIILPVDE